MAASTYHGKWNWLAWRRRNGTYRWHTGHNSGDPRDSRAGLAPLQVPRGPPPPAMALAGKFPLPACGRGGSAQSVKTLSNLGKGVGIFLGHSIEPSVVRAPPYSPVFLPHEDHRLMPTPTGMAPLCLHPTSVGRCPFLFTSNPVASVVVVVVGPRITSVNAMLHGRETSQVKVMLSKDVCISG